MKIEVDNGEFCMRLYQNVAYLKVVGIQNKAGADFFESKIDEVVGKYPYDRFASLCDLTELILPHPTISKQINSAIFKLSDNLNYEYNAVIVEAKFMQIMQAYIFSFFMRNISAKTKIFTKKDKAIEWLKRFEYQLDEIEEFLKGKGD